MLKQNLLAAAAAAGVCLLVPGAAFAQSAQSAAARLNELGSENVAMASRAGTWDVTETVWDGPGTSPKVTEGAVAERRMVGSMLQETLRSPSDPARVLRVDYLTLNRLEGHWQYVSMDTRAPVGIMQASSYGPDETERIALTFMPFAVPGPGAEASGLLLRMRQDIVAQGPDRDLKDQYFTMADGTGKAWLAHRYAYVRRP